MVEVWRNVVLAVAHDGQRDIRSHQRRRRRWEYVGDNAHVVERYASCVVRRSAVETNHYYPTRTQNYFSQVHALTKSYQR
jgi:hypothetical protein